jgi:hypothetical protein
MRPSPRRYLRMLARRSARSRPSCSAFRTFQGRTALSDMLPDRGVLHAVPIPAAMGYILLRAQLRW